MKKIESTFNKIENKITSTREMLERNRKLILSLKIEKPKQVLNQLVQVEV